MNPDIIIVDDEKAYKYKYNNNYYITKTGKLYSIYMKGSHGKTDISNPRKVAYGEDRDGYYRVILSFQGKRKYIKIHQIVANQFLGECPAPFVINHKDGNKHNNNLENLEIVTVKENCIHAHKNGLTTREVPVDIIFNGKKHHFSSKKECIEFFPDLTLRYLKQIEQNVVLFSMIKFEKEDPAKRIGKINSYYNGKLYKKFNSMTEAEKFFKTKRGSVSSAILNCSYRNKINKYIITFPNVSTIESTK